MAVAPKRGPYESSAEIAPVTEAGFPQISRGIVGRQYSKEAYSVLTPQIYFRFGLYRYSAFERLRNDFVGLEMCKEK